MLLFTENSCLFHLKCGAGTAEEDAGAKLADFIYDAATEAEVVEWMNTQKVNQADLSHRHPTTGDTALLLAIRKRMTAVAQSLLQVNVPIGDRNAAGDTALHWAAFLSGDEPAMVQLVEALLAAGADADAVGDLGNTPLHLAATANSAMVRAPRFCLPLLLHAVQHLAVTAHDTVVRPQPVVTSQGEG